MENSKRVLLLGLYVLFGMTIEGFILWLFPFTGLGGLICLPTAIICSFGFGFIIYKLTKRQHKVWQILIAFFALISIQSYVQLSSIPQDFGGDAFSKISDAKSGFSKYDSIEFYDFPNLTIGERVAYICLLYTSPSPRDA